ncbi:hypothetical protein [Bradyrhizobium sp. USDA 4502]
MSDNLPVKSREFTAVVVASIAAFFAALAAFAASVQAYVSWEGRSDVAKASLASILAVHCNEALTILGHMENRNYSISNDKSASWNQLLDTENDAKRLNREVALLQGPPRALIDNQKDFVQRYVSSSHALYDAILEQRAILDKTGKLDPGVQKIGYALRDMAIVIPDICADDHFAQK